MLDEQTRTLVDRYETIAPDGLRMALWYDGDEHDVVHVRADVREIHAPNEFDERVKQLVAEGLGDPPAQEQFRLFGELNAAVRRFDDAVVIHYPVEEFAGIAVTFDADRVPSLDTLVDVGVEALADAADQ